MSTYNFTKEDLLGKCKDAMMNSALFYGRSFIVSEDGLKDDHHTYRTEVVAGFILENISEFRKRISTIDREKYKILTHNGEETDSNQEEKNLAKKLFKQSEFDNKKYPYIGMIADYEVPLKKCNEDRGVGRIDLLSLNNDEKTVYILELKKKSSRESMLRCVLEAYTYSRIVNKSNLFDSFGIPQDYNLQPSPLVFKGGVQWEQIDEMRRGNRPKLMELMRELDVKPFFLDGPQEDGTYDVSLE